MELHLKIIGALLVVLALMHIAFPRYFKWSAELGSLSLMNRQMMYVHAFFIALVVLLMGLLCLTSSDELVTTPLGRKVSLGLAAFWLIRLVFQLCVYSSQLWRGKTMETAIHIAFTLFWAYTGGTFLMAYLSTGS